MLMGDESGGEKKECERMLGLCLYERHSNCKKKRLIQPPGNSPQKFSHQFTWYLSRKKENDEKSRKDDTQMFMQKQQRSNKSSWRDRRI